MNIIHVTVGPGHLTRRVCMNRLLPIGTDTTRGINAAPVNPQD